MYSFNSLHWILSRMSRDEVERELLPPFNSLHWILETYAPKLATIEEYTTFNSLHWIHYIRLRGPSPGALQVEAFNSLHWIHVVVLGYDVDRDNPLSILYIGF